MMNRTTRHADRTATSLGKLALVSAMALGGGYLATTITAVSASPTVAAPTPAEVAPPSQVSGFVPIAGYRTYDSRTDPGESGKIFIKSDRFVDAAVDLDGVERIPDQATGVTFNITVTQTEGWGYVQVAAPGTGISTRRRP